MKSIEGWVYHCEECGGYHLVPVSILNEKPESLKIKCPHSEEDTAQEYGKVCFSEHSGPWTAEVLEKQNII